MLPYPPKGGVVQRSYNLIKETSKKHEIYLVAYNHEARRDLGVAISHLRQICREVEVIDCPVNKQEKYRIALSSIVSSLPYTARWLSSQEFSLIIRKVIETLKIDIAHFDSIDVVEYMQEIGELPKVLNHHNIESQMMFRRFLKEKNLFKRMYFLLEALKLRRFERKVCPLFDMNLTVSELDKERLQRIIGKSRIEAIPNGVDVTYFKPSGDDIEARSLIFAGGMEWYPNREAMLFFCKKIWPLLKKRIPGVKMTIIGRSPPDYMTRISHTDPNLIVTGFVEDVRPYIRRAEVYVCPIRDGGGTKLKILDALAMGKPVVAHPVAIEGIDVETEKHVLTAETPEEFVQQITRLFQDKNLCDVLKKEGQKLVMERYDFRKIGEKLSQVYLQLRA